MLPGWIHAAWSEHWGRMPELNQADVERGVMRSLRVADLSMVQRQRLIAIIRAKWEGILAWRVFGIGDPTADNSTSAAMEGFESIDEVEALARYHAIGLFCPLPSGAWWRPAPNPVSKAEAYHWLLAQTRRVSQLHQSGLVHGDIRPGRLWKAEARNAGAGQDLFLDPSGCLFAIEPSRAESVASGTALYAAPERWTASAEPSPSGDVYALGCLAYQCLEGKPAFDAASADEIRARHLGPRPTELREANERGAEGDPFLRILHASLSVDPATRFPDAVALERALAAIEPMMAKQASPTDEKALVREPAGRPKPPVSVTAQDAAIKAVESPVAPKTPAKSRKHKDAPTAEPPVLERPRAPVPPASPKDVAKHRETKTAIPDVEPLGASLQVNASEAESTVSDEPDSADPYPRRGVRRRRNWWAPYFLGGLCVPVVLLVVALILQDPNPGPIVRKRTRPAIPSIVPAVRTTPLARSTAPPVTDRSNALGRSDNQAEVPRVQLVDSDEMLWAAPTLSRSTDPDEATGITRLLPPGPAAILYLRPDHIEQAGWIDDLALEIQPWVREMESQSGVSWSQMRQVVVAFFPGANGRPERTFAVWLREPIALSVLAESWEATPARGADGSMVFAGDERDSLAYYPLAQNQVDEPSGDEPIGAFAVGDIERISDVASLAAAPVVLPRSLRGLWQAVSPEDTLAVLTQPNFIASDARAWTNAASPDLRSWFRSNLVGDCNGLLLRVANETQDQVATYVELRLANSVGSDPNVVATRIETAVDQLVEYTGHVAKKGDVANSWKQLATRLPGMWGFAREQLRRGREDRDWVFNTYLPTRGLPQITMGTLMAANTELLAEQTAVVTRVLSVEEMLDVPMSIQFGQESLQASMALVGELFNADRPATNQLPAIEILGGDLEKMGITQNQQVRDFDQRDQPLRNVLTKLVLGANPDRTASGPDDTKQSLVWVIEGAGKEARLLITTRQAAEGTYTLPKEFVVPNP